jgi:hypothetical protein
MRHLEAVAACFFGVGRIDKKEERRVRKGALMMACETS